MQLQDIRQSRAGETRAASWGGVFSMALGAFALVASEFMPVSLLTPIAEALQVSEGQAGQAISVSGGFALLTSLVIAPLAGRLDRRHLLLGLNLLTILSGITVALAPNFAIFMLGRALIGVAIGGFWSLSAATVMRLVPAEGLPRALAILNGGNALATVVAAPAGSFLGALIGWRGAFFCVVPVAALVLAWQWANLPAMRVQARVSALAVFALLGQPVVALGMLAASLFFMGQFALFTYLRPFLETVTRVEVSSLSLLLLMMGAAGFLGTTLIGGLLKARLYPTLVAIPLVMAALALGLVGWGQSLAATTLLLGLWGLFATSAPVGWWTWLARVLPRAAEAGGGLMVAVVQLAITAGALLGGLLYDHSGYQASFGFAAAVLVLGAGVTLLTARKAE